MGDWTIRFSLPFQKEGTDMPDAERCFRYIVKEIHTTIVATTDDDGLPVTAAIDFICIYYGSQIALFLHQRSKSFLIIGNTGLTELIHYLFKSVKQIL